MNAGPKSFLRIAQKYEEKFVKKTEIVLDKRTAACYHNQARVGELCPARNAMMQEIAS